MNLHANAEGSDALEGLTDTDLDGISNIVPTIGIPRSELAAGILIVDLLARTLGDQAKPMSKGAARRLVEQGGAYVNRVKITTADHKVTLDHLATETMLVVSGGKKDHRIVRAI